MRFQASIRRVQRAHNSVRGRAGTVNITASIQARLGSSRLPGKVLKDVCGKPMLQWQIERLKRSRLVDRVVVATTINPGDDRIESFCRENDTECYRGSEENVLGRVASLIREMEIDLHVECYGDSPLVDPQIVDEFIGYYLKYSDSVDYVSSALKTTYPPGLEVVVYPGEVMLKTDAAVAAGDPLREHAGFNITRFPDQFRLFSMDAPPAYRYPDTYLEVDTTEDLEVMRTVIGYFVERGQEHFTLAQILDMVRAYPEILQRNAGIERRWKALRDEGDV